jgi:hypothetical protein
MAIYYGIKKVLEHGQWIGYASRKMVYVKNTEALVGIIRGSKYAIAADVTLERDYKAFYKACTEGEWLDMELYRLARADAEKMPDEGRITIKELERLMKRGGAR